MAKPAAPARHRGGRFFRLGRLAYDTPAFIRGVGCFIACAGARYHNFRAQSPQPFGYTPSGRMGKRPIILTKRSCSHTGSSRQIMQHSHIAYPPAEGERRAMSGYYPQYHISASLILRSLREENLQWIRIADPQAGRVDDLQIGSQSRIDAFQVKWGQYQELFTYRELTR